MTTLYEFNGAKQLFSIQNLWHKALHLNISMDDMFSHIDISYQ